MAKKYEEEYKKLKDIYENEIQELDAQNSAKYMEEVDKLEDSKRLYDTENNKRSK